MILVFLTATLICFTVLTGIRFVAWLIRRAGDTTIEIGFVNPGIPEPQKCPVKPLKSILRHPASQHLRVVK